MLYRASLLSASTSVRKRRRPAQVHRSGPLGFRLAKTASACGGGPAAPQIPSPETDRRDSRHPFDRTVRGTARAISDTRPAAIAWCLRFSSQSAGSLRRIFGWIRSSRRTVRYGSALRLRRGKYPGFRRARNTRRPSPPGRASRNRCFPDARANLRAGSPRLRAR